MIEVVKFVTEGGQEHYAQAGPVSSRLDLIRRYVKRAQAQGDPIRSLELLEMDEEDYWRIPATNASFTFFDRSGAARRELKGER